MDPKVSEMKLVYETRDGQKYGGENAAEVCRAMRNDSSFTSDKSLEKFLMGAAERYSRYDNVIVRADTPENFLHDLEAANILKKVTS
jgi:hypothetical protein